MGDKMYSTKVDMRATGCIFAELLAIRTFFRWESNRDVLLDIIK